MMTCASLTLYVPRGQSKRSVSAGEIEGLLTKWVIGKAERDWWASGVETQAKWLGAKRVLEAYVWCPAAKGIRWHYNYSSHKIQVLLAFPSFRTCTSESICFCAAKCCRLLPQIVCIFPKNSSSCFPHTLNYTISSFVILWDKIADKNLKNVWRYAYFLLSFIWEVEFLSFWMTVMSEVSSFLPHYPSSLVTCFLGGHLSCRINNSIFLRSYPLR